MWGFNGRKTRLAGEVAPTPVFGKFLILNNLTGYIGSCSSLRVTYGSTGDYQVPAAFAVWQRATFWRRASGCH